jgi:hypothetical protein
MTMATTTKTTFTRITPELAAAETCLGLPGGVRLPVRMTATRLPDGAVALISPLRIDDELARQIAELGPVRYLVAPNTYHHLYLGAARERYPDALLVGAPGLAKKRADLSFDHELGAGPPPWGDGLTPHLIAGAPRMNEVVLHHPASRTLVTTDLLFNVVEPDNLMTSLALRMMGTRGKLARSRMWRLLVKDRDAFERSLEEILAADFDRVIMAHGDVVETDGRAGMTRALGRA